MPKAKADIPYASMRIPGKMTLRKVWIGSYGGFFDVVVVFNKKPRKDGPNDPFPGEYSLAENRKIIAGSFDKDSFNEWFGTSIEPSHTDITSVEEYHLMAIWDEHGRIVGLNPSYD